MKIVAVIPAYNEEIALGSVIARAKQYVNEVIVVDDGSEDATSNIAQIMNVTLLRHDKNLGKGAALHTAFKWALNNDIDILVTIDADGQHCPDEIPNLIDPIIKNKASIVNGSRFLNGNNCDVPKYRRVGQKALNLAINKTCDTKINDSQSGFRAFEKETFSVFSFNNKGMGVESEMISDAINAGYEIVEVPISCRYDIDGSTFNPFYHGASVLNSILNIFQRKHPLLYFGIPGALFMLIGIFLGIWTIYGYNSGDGFWIGKALLAMTFIIVGLFSLFSGLILNSITAFLNTRISP